MSNRSKYRRLVKFNEEIELINNSLTGIIDDDYGEESEDEIERQYRKYFKCENNNK